EEIFDYSMGDEVTMAMMSLPEEFREVILMCDIENFSYEEIAKTIELPIGTVRSRLFRARNMLKEKLKKYALDLGYRDMRGQNKIKNSIQEEE
ncbi:MAG TPA: sigma factor-like helix-turn-helix DNA-binding protein, partial [Saprospiraceae bacterium]|nr:sigma factor-like helix-turn-helix DNA-binding protein [Saprospiraceae bacterium]